MAGAILVTETYETQAWLCLCTVQRVPSCQGDACVTHTACNSFIVGEGDYKQPYSKQEDWKLKWKVLEVQVSVSGQIFFFFLTTAQEKRNVLVFPFTYPFLGRLSLIPPLIPAPYTLYLFNLSILSKWVNFPFGYRAESSHRGIRWVPDPLQEKMEAESSQFVSSKPPDCRSISGNCSLKMQFYICPKLI